MKFLLIKDPLVRSESYSYALGVGEIIYNAVRNYIYIKKGVVLDSPLRSPTTLQTDTNEQH